MTHFKSNINYSFLFFLGVLFLSYGCTQSKAYKKPKDLIEEKQFVNVLVDIRLLEAYLRDFESHGNVTKKDAKRLYKELFLKNKITQQQFNSSLAYYSLQPEIMMNINEKVVDKLVEMESEATTQKHIDDKKLNNKK